MAQIHLQDNFGAGPISQVPASWFNSVAKFINNLIGGEGIDVNKQIDGAASIIELKGNELGGNPTDNTDASEEGEDPEASTLTFTDWTAGGENGVKLRLYGLVQDDNGAHIFQPVDFEIAANGIVKSVKAPEGDHGIFVGA